MATWTGSAFFVWGGASREDGSGLDCSESKIAVDTYQFAGPDTSCLNSPLGMPCDPVKPSSILVANDGFIIRPSL